MEELIKVLEKSVSSQQKDQNEAIAFIQQYIERDYSGFLKALSDILYNLDNPALARLSAGLQMKNQLSARDEVTRSKQQDRWRSLPEETRQYIKERVFQALGTEVSVSQCLAYIAYIELPEGRWPELIQALIHNITKPQATNAIKFASLEVIGLIWQEIPPGQISEVIDAVVSGGMESDKEDVRTAAANALLNFSKNQILQISTSQPKISFDELGESLNIKAEYAERMVAQMIRDDKLKGYLDQINRFVHFQAVDVLQTFDEQIVSLCSEVNSVVEKIRTVVPEEWWTTNACQTQC